MTERGLTDVGTRTAVHGQAVAAFAYDLDGTAGRACLFGQQGGEPGCVRAADRDAWAQTCTGEVRHLLVGDDSALLERDDVVGGTRGLLWIRRTEQDGAALGGMGAQRVVEATGLMGGQRSSGVVEHQGVRIGKQSTGQSEASVHTAGEGAEAFAAQAREFGRLQDFVGPPGGKPGRRAQHAEMAANRPGRVPRHISQQDSDLVRGVGDAVQGPASEVGETTAVLEFEHESERRRLAGARRSEQCGDVARARLEGDVVDGGRKLLAGVAGQSEGLDHP